MSFSELFDLARRTLLLGWNWLMQLSSELQERLAPLLLELEPVLSDPLWRALITIFLVVVTFLLGLWLLKRGSSGVIGLFSGLWSVLKGSLGALASPIQTISKLFNKLKQSYARKARNRLALKLRMQRILDSLKYLSTSRDWRYKTPWFLLLGDKHASALELIAGISSGRRAALLSREKLMQVAGSQWHFFDNGVVINPQDPLLDNTSDAQQAKVLGNKKLNKLLELIHRYRPERALDGVVLCVSAKSLLAAQDPLALKNIGEQLFQQLWSVQKNTGFVLPVYMVLTECEAVQGFEAYWQAQSPHRLNEIFGWSNPSTLETPFNSEWIEQAFDTINRALQQAQVEVSASNQEIENIDEFMLFHQCFQRLLAPLKEVVDSALSPSRFQAPMPLRGIFCTGKLAQKVAFADDLFNKKIFPELNLAVPIERKLLSSERTLRRFQITTIAMGLLALIWLGVDGVRMKMHNDNLARVLGQIMVDPSYKTRVNGALDCSDFGLNSYRLLAALDEVGAHPNYYSMPISTFFDVQFENVQQFVAQELLAPHLFASLDCRLRTKLDQLASWPEQYPLSTVAKEDLDKSLIDYSQAMSRLHREHDDFLYLIGPLGDDKKVAMKLKGLLDYLYDSPTPEEAIPKKPLVTGAVKVMTYTVKSAVTDDPAVFNRKQNVNYLYELAKKAEVQLFAEAKFTPVDKLQVPNSDEGARLLANLIQLGQWVSKMNHQWSVPYASSPCGRIGEQLASAIEVLELSGYYSKNDLNRVAGLFSEKQCYARAREQLVGVSVGSFEQIFSNQNGILSVSPTVAPMLLEIRDMQKLPFMQSDAPRVVPNHEPVIGWRAADLLAALNAISEYQKFAALYWQNAESPFAPALKHSLSVAISQHIQKAMVRPSTSGQKASMLRNVNDAEVKLSEQVGQFNQVQAILVNLDQLLDQLGDEQNRVWLQQSAKQFVSDRLSDLDTLVSDNRIYQSVSSPQWQKPSLAQALFNLQSTKQVEQYSITQRQRLGLLTHSYAQPLLNYLYNIGGIELAGSSAQRWYATLLTLTDYERHIANTDLDKLESYLNVTLASGQQQVCPDSMQSEVEALGGSWFAERFVRLDRQVWVHCKDSNEARAVDQFIAFSRRFDQKIAGRFPFAPLSSAGRSDLTLPVALAFFNDPNNDPEKLIKQLTQLKQSMPAAVPDQWLDFLGQLQDFSRWLRDGLTADSKNWAVPLKVSFQALPEYAQGADQIIRWTLSNGQQKSVFPNDDQTLTWQQGQPLWLELEWANSSAYQPYTQSNIPAAIHIPEQHSVRFVTSSQWGMFEWLQRYSNKSAALLKSIPLGTQLFSFSVPVTLKAAPIQSQSVAYVSQAMLSVSATYLDKNGVAQPLLWPVDLPQRAPGLNE